MLKRTVCHAEVRDMSVETSPTYREFTEPFKALLGHRQPSQDGASASRVDEDTPMASLLTRSRMIYSQSGRRFLAIWDTAKAAAP